ncbi:MAG: ABC transporter substrate binding protein [Pleomorphochaeta sp.]
MNKIKTYIIFLILLILPNTFIFASDSSPYNILLFNSYHLGYTWSDEIYTGICTVLEGNDHPYNIDIEYMDTQKTISENYLDNLYDIYYCKFINSNYDVIITSDDAAYNFLREHGENLFGTTPIVFCGVNSFNEKEIENLPNFTGVVETYDISGTIKLALEQNPNTKTIYYINDDSLTGKSIMKEFLPVIDEYSDQVNFIRIDGSNYQNILNQSNNLEDDSIVLFLIYFLDRDNNRFEYDEAISLLYNECNRPIYGVWDFHLGHGIIGGKLVSGFNQGELAANQAIEILNGKAPKDIDVITEDTTSYAFDYEILDKYNISAENLPKESKLINIKSDDSYHVLILHSYNRNLQWTEDIERGIRENIQGASDNVTFSIDYMDAKQHPEEKYQMYLYDFLSKKYYLNSFDLVITSDDAAFNFITNYSNLVSDDTPIFFCGVNNKVDSTSIDTNKITGVIESNDYQSTIEIMKDFHPNRDRIIVINDNTITGKANKKNIEEIIPQFEDDLDFVFLEDYNMNELLLECESLTDRDSVLLLSFTQDRSFNNFTYNESLNLISSHTEVPIYGLWDFYLGNGIVGGSLKSGYNQGALLAEMITSYISGTPISEMPIQIAGLDEYQFDYEQLSKFDIPIKSIPQEAKIINKPFSIVDFIERNIIYISGVILLLLIILLMSLNINLSKKVIKQEKSQARTDKLTGILNRRACFEVLEERINYCKESNTDLTICFADINKLKFVNDNYGHEVGDILIKSISDVFARNIRNKDSICRLGGDEFLFIFPESDIDQAQEILNLIYKQLEVINNSKKYPFTLSFSYGFSSYDKYICNNASTLISIADKKMYEHKINQKKKSKKI